MNTLTHAHTHTHTVTHMCAHTHILMHTEYRYTHIHTPTHTHTHTHTHTYRLMDTQPSQLPLSCYYTAWYGICVKHICTLTHSHPCFFLWWLMRIVVHVYGHSFFNICEHCENMSKQFSLVQCRNVF